MPRHNNISRRHAFGGAAVLLITLAVPAAQAAEPLQVEASTVLPTAPAAVWAAVGDFGTLGWHPVVAKVDIAEGRADRPGGVRVVSTKDGARIVEALEARDDATRMLRYRIVESPLPVRHYVSTLQVLPEGSGSRVVWGSRFERDPAAAGVDDEQARTIVRGIYTTGFEGLRRQLGIAAP